MATNPSRIVLPEDERPKAEAILEATGIKTFSQLFSILLVNYGDHLVSALKAVPTAPPPPVAMPASVDARPQPRQLPSIQPTQQIVAPSFKPLTGI